MEPADLVPLKAIIADMFPDLAGGRFTLLTEGWDSLAVDVDDRWIFKFPRDEEAEVRLRQEAAVLAVVRETVRMPVPVLTLYEGRRLFSRHEKLPGEHLLAHEYDQLPKSARQALADAMAGLFADIHRLDSARMHKIGARPIGTWAGPDEVERDLEPVLPPHLRGFADRTLAAFRALPPDPYGEIYGYFDGHGWNMAYDHASQRLNGVYDFADSGLGPLHREFVPPGFIARDLTWRIIDAYERLTGRAIDRARVDTMTAYLRLAELTGVEKERPELVPLVKSQLERWAGGL